MAPAHLPANPTRKFRQPYRDRCPQRPRPCSSVTVYSTSAFPVGAAPLLGRCRQLLHASMSRAAATPSTRNQDTLNTPLTNPRHTREKAAENHRATQAPTRTLRQVPAKDTQCTTTHMPTSKHSVGAGQSMRPRACPFAAVWPAGCDAARQLIPRENQKPKTQQTRCAALVLCAPHDAIAAAAPHVAE